MSRQRIKAPRNKFKGKRKPPQFAIAIDNILRDTTVTLDEMTEASPDRVVNEESGRIELKYRPEGCIFVESLQGHYPFKEERLMKYYDLIRKFLLEFGEEFYSDEGASLMDMRFDRKGRSWDGSGGHLAAGLTYLAIGLEMAEWTKPREDWKNLPDGVPYVRFKKELKEENPNERN